MKKLTLGKKQKNEMFSFPEKSHLFLCCTIVTEESLVSPKGPKRNR